MGCGVVSEGGGGEEPGSTAPSLARRRARAVTTGPDLGARIARVTPGILEHVRAGNFPAIAAQSQGVPLRTWQQWRQWADQGDIECTELFERVDCALADAEIALVAKLSNPPMDGLGKADTGWIKATTFILERTRRERWGDKIEVQIRVEDTMRGFFEELERRLSPAAFDELVMAMSAMKMEQLSGGG